MSLARLTRPGRIAGPLSDGPACCPALKRSEPTSLARLARPDGDKFPGPRAGVDGSEDAGVPGRGDRILLMNPSRSSRALFEVGGLDAWISCSVNDIAMGDKLFTDYSPHLCVRMSVLRVLSSSQPIFASWPPGLLVGAPA